MKIFRATIMACVILFISGCTGESVSDGLEKLEDITDWFEGDDDSDQGDGTLSAQGTDITGSDTTPVSNGLSATTDASEESTTDSADLSSGDTEEESEEQTDISPYTEAFLSAGQGTSVAVDTATGQLISTAEFMFATARAVSVEINLRDMSAIQAHLSICTEYQEALVGYEVNYESCLVQGALTDGQFATQFLLANEYDAAIGVIWFPNLELATLYQEFQISENVVELEVDEWLWE